MPSTFMCSLFDMCSSSSISVPFALFLLSRPPKRWQVLPFLGCKGRGAVGKSNVVAAIVPSDKRRHCSLLQRCWVNPFWDLKSLRLQYWQVNLFMVAQKCERHHKNLCVGRKRLGTNFWGVIFCMEKNSTQKNSALFCKDYFHLGHETVGRLGI